MKSSAASLVTPWPGACAARSLLPRLALVRAPLLLICMATGIMVFLTDSYHVKDAAGNMIVDQVPGAIAGPNVVHHAIDSSLPGWEVLQSRLLSCSLHLPRRCSSSTLRQPTWSASWERSATCSSRALSGVARWLLPSSVVSSPLMRCRQQAIPHTDFKLG